MVAVHALTVSHPPPAPLPLEVETRFRREVQRLRREVTPLLGVGAPVTALLHSYVDGMAEKFGWRPNDYLENPRAFGKEDTSPVWRETWFDGTVIQDDPRHHDRQIAAKIQHLVAIEVTRAARLRDETLADVSKHTRMGADQFRRLMRGEGPMQVVDFATFRRVYHVDFGINPDPGLANIRETKF